MITTVTIQTILTIVPITLLVSTSFFAWLMGPTKKKVLRRRERRMERKMERERKRKRRMEREIKMERDKDGEREEDGER